MMKFLYSFFILLFSINSYSKGLIQSHDKWEPQIIIVKESLEDDELIEFEFCMSRRKKKCHKLHEGKGVEKSVLLREALFAQKAYAFTNMFISILSFNLSGKFFKQTGNYITGSLTNTAISELNEAEFTSTYWDDLRLILDPTKYRRIVLSDENMSIVTFARMLKIKLKKIMMPCNIDIDSKECYEYNKLNTRLSDEINDKFSTMNAL